MTTYLFWPPDAVDWNNPYLKLFHAAMLRHGIAYDSGIGQTVEFLQANAGKFAGIHIHWPEGLWRYTDSRGGVRRVLTQMRKARRLWELRRFLRTARRLGYRIVWTVHNAAPHEGPSWADRVGYRLLGQYSDVLVFHSEAARDEYGTAGERAIVMRLGTYAGVYPPPGSAAETRTRYDIPSEAKRLVCVGLIRPYKGMDVAAEAVKRLGAGYHLLVAGPPKDPKAVAEVQRIAATAGNVTVLGRELSDQEFADVHAAADAVLLPYRKITGSSALLAAVGFGRGVIASDLPYFQEYARLEPAFVELARPGDAADLAATIERYFAIGAEHHHAAAERLSIESAWEVVTEPLARILAPQH